MRYSLIFFLIFSIFSSLAPPASYGKILDVQTDGSGNFLTINEAIQAAQDGDTVLIGPGIFQESIEINKNNITLVGSGADITHIDVTGNFCLSIENSSNISIKDIFFYTESDMGDSTIYIDSSSVELSYCVIKSSPDAYGIYCISGSSVRVIHNTILDHKKEGGIRFDDSCEMVIKSNIFMGNSVGINNVGKLFATPDVSHNLFWKNGADYNNCKKGSGDVFSNPLFVNLPQNDYRLKHSSPCIGAAHDKTEIGAFPLKKRPRKVKPQKILPPELSLGASLEGFGEDGMLNGGEQGVLTVTISNSGTGPAHDVTISYHSASRVIGEGRQKIKKIPPQSKKKVRFTLTIPTDVSDEETSIRLEALDKAGFKAEPLTMDVAILSSLGRLTIETDPEKASVYLDGTPRGEAPLILEKLLPKTYQVRITLDNYAEINEKITIEPRADEVRQFVLLKLKGDLFLETVPTQAKITLQGQVQQETTPLKISYIDVGSYQIAAEKYDPTMIYRYEGEITIKPGENKIKIDQFTATPVPSGMVLIPEGEFEMGSDGASPDENPAHKVYLKNYYIDKYEVSWAEFMKFVQAQRRPQPFYANDSRFNNPNYPAVGITFEEAQAYAKWVNKRLPTEAEWEKAARGTEKWKYPWGNEFSIDKVNCATDADRYNYTAPVNSFPGGASPYGLLHMAGNVWEWCSDYYNATYYYISPPRNPKGPKEEERHVLRGGSWDSTRFDIRTTRRWSYWPDLQRNYIGLRLVFPPE